MKFESKSFFQQLIFFLSSIIFCYAQQGGPNQLNLENSFELDDCLRLQVSELDSLITWQERIVLHVDKATIAKDEPIFFKAYAMTGSNRVRISLSKVLKVELLNNENETVAAQYHKIEDGMAVGAIPVPKKLDDGVYTLRAYTRWMKNYGESFYFTKQLQLGSTENIKKKDNDLTNPLSVSFHPEGGNLIATLNNKLLIKVNTNSSEIADFNSKIVDESNNIVADVVPFGSGLLSAIFNPSPTQSYRLKTENGNIFPLPEIQPKGYVISVNNLDPFVLSIRIQATSDFVNSKVWLKGEMSGVTYFKKELEFQESSIDLNVPIHGIPSGVLTVSLNDDEGNQWAIRPVSLDAKNNLKFEIVRVEEGVNSDERSFKIKLTDPEGKPVAGEVSISATTFESSSVVLETTKSKGLNWERNEMGTGKNQGERKERFMADLEVLTLADADYDRIAQKLPKRIKYPFQLGLDLFGYAYNLNNELLKNTEIQMLGASDANVITQVFKTDASGRLRLENLQLIGETELVFRTTGDDSSSRLVKIVPFQERYENKNSPKARLDFSKQKKGKITNTSPWQPDAEGELIVLDEVEVTEKKKQEKKTSPSVYGIEPTKVKFQDPVKPKSIPQLFLGIPGVTVVGLGGIQPQVVLPLAAGTGPVLWVLDGMPLMQPTGLVDIMNLVSHTDVERIEILYRTTAAIYGSRASGGAIIIYTRSAAGMDYVDRKEGRLNFQGYFESPTFKEHIDEVIKKPKKYVDSTTTLFWSPNIKTDKNGEATIRFKVPFDYKHLELKASTITEKGEVGSTTVVF